MRGPLLVILALLVAACGQDRAARQTEFALEHATVRTTFPPGWTEQVMQRKNYPERVAFQRRDGEEVSGSVVISVSPRNHEDKLEPNESLEYFLTEMCFQCRTIEPVREFATGRYVMSYEQDGARHVEASWRVGELLVLCRGDVEGSALSAFGHLQQTCLELSVVAP